MEFDIKSICQRIYQETLEAELSNHCRSNNKKDDTQAHAQKKAIMAATIVALRSFPNIEASVIWREVYSIHVHSKSGVDDIETIRKVIAADQSWKKSSGHAFEEMIKDLGNCALAGTGIEIVLQRDLNQLIKENLISNEPRDISWLREQIKSSIFDLYSIVNISGKKYCYGCIQSKTSIRDRVTRDREPSLQAMDSFFWSTIVVLDGDFLKLPKFISMVNGGTNEHPTNGWHGMYVFSNNYSIDRIYSTDLDFSNFKEHAVKAAKYWLTQRQWFNRDWKA